MNPPHACSHEFGRVAHAFPCAQAEPRAGGRYVLPPLPYDESALEPVISANTLRIHHGQYHRAHLSKLEALVAGTDLDGRTVEEIMLGTAGHPDQRAIFDNAAQAWNHAFYWNSLSPHGGGIPPPVLKSRIDRSFGSLAMLRNEIYRVAVSGCRYGWAWLVVDREELRIIQTSNAANPLAQRVTPLLAIDVWEQACCSGFQNHRPDYVKGVLDKLINWEFASRNLRYQ